MSKSFVVSVNRNGWSWPKLSIVILGTCSTPAAADAFINRHLRRLYEKRRGGRFSKYSSMRVSDFRVVDAAGLKRLYAAAQASVTIRRKRAAKTGVITRLRNRGLTLKVDRNTLTYTIVPKQ